MSRFTLPLTNGDGAYIAYGFDHIVGPFIELRLPDGTLETSRTYIKDRAFDCHELARVLHNLQNQYLIPYILRTLQHIHLLTLDRPI